MKRLAREAAAWGIAQAMVGGLFVGAALFWCAERAVRGTWKAAAAAGRVLVNGGTQR